MGFSWIDETINRNRRSGSNWLHDIGPEEVQKGFFFVLKDIENGHFDMKHFGTVILDEVFINESYNAALHRSNDNFYKSWALSYWVDRVMRGEEVDRFGIMNEVNLIGLEHDTYQAWTKAVDAYRYTHDPNQILFGMDEIQTLGKRKKIIRDTIDIETKPRNVIWSDYRAINTMGVDKFIRTLNKGKVSVMDTINTIAKNPMILSRARELAQKRYILYGEIESGYRKILDQNPMNPDQWVMTSYHQIKRSQTAYNILIDKLDMLLTMPLNDPRFKGTMIALKALLIKDYNGAL